MKNFVLLFLICFCLPAYTAMLTGEIKYTQNDALIELQNNKPYGFDFLLTIDHITDKNKKENIACLLEGKTKLIDRTIGKFSDGSYAINYKKDPFYVWYYDKNGNLINSEIRSSLDYPYRSYKYSTDGELVNMSMRISEDETYIFSAIGELLGHWVGQNCYDKNGTIVMTRTILKDKHSNKSD